MALVNGVTGIGTGWSTNIPSFHPRDIIVNIGRLLNDETMEPMVPWYRGFTGTIKKVSPEEGEHCYTCSGKVEVDGTVRITELPIGLTSQAYRKKLDSLNAAGFITSYKNTSIGEHVGFDVKMTQTQLIKAKKKGLLETLKLVTKISTGNMHLYDSSGSVTKYLDPEHVLKEFYSWRLEVYESRKRYNVKALNKEVLIGQNLLKYVEAVNSGEINVVQENEDAMLADLQKQGIVGIPQEETQKNGEAQDQVRLTDYDYLFNLSSKMLRDKKGVSDKMDKSIQRLANLNKFSAKDIWIWELYKLEKALDVTGYMSAEQASKKPAPRKPRRLADPNSESAVESSMSAATSVMDIVMQRTSKSSSSEGLKSSGSSSSEARGTPLKKVRRGFPFNKQSTSRFAV